MAALLWIDTEADRAVYLGDPFRLRAAFCDLARVAGDDSVRVNAELYGVPEACALQDDVAADWLQSVRRQAGQMLARFGPKLSDDARWVLTQLKEEAAGD